MPACLPGISCRGRKRRHFGNEHFIFFARFTRFSAKLSFVMSGGYGPGQQRTIPRVRCSLFALDESSSSLLRWMLCCRNPSLLYPRRAAVGMDPNIPNLDLNVEVCVPSHLSAAAMK